MYLLVYVNTLIFSGGSQLFDACPWRSGVVLGGVRRAGLHPFDTTDDSERTVGRVSRQLAAVGPPRLTAE